MSNHIPFDVLQFLNTILNEAEKDDFSIEISEEFNKGEGLVGDLFAITLVNKRNQEKRNVIVKQQLCLDGKPLEFTFKPFENEIRFYSDIWPRLFHMYENQTDRSVEFVPNCLGTSHNATMKIALENLAAQGFLSHDKTKALDDEHLKLTFKTFGIFHGLSMALKKQNTEEYSRLVGPLHFIWKEAFTKENVTAKCLKLFSGLVQNFFDPLTEEHLLEKLRLYENEGPELICEVLNQEIVNGVIIHGDGWSNNFLFKYDEKRKPQEIRFIDFQQISNGSPALDLSYCFYSGGSGEAFDKLDYYLKIYHDTLSDTLKKFGLQIEEIYSFQTLKQEWRIYCKFGFAMGLLLWRLKLADKDFVPNLAEYENKPVIQPPKIADDKKDEYKHRMRELVAHMYKNDFF